MKASASRLNSEGVWFTMYSDGSVPSLNALASGIDVENDNARSLSTQDTNIQFFPPIKVAKRDLDPFNCITVLRLLPS